ncbi:RNA polymerase sigma factor [Aliidiomarina halalkaliphila]|uniref:RNA polymerase sigma factor n=1 Tax=Aliidiomarina halalkaliphila TaxID=2593535 RepID=A0A552X078_9GAMM|nr:RNA polymerase sigma factor [Aliidiomarina halalkaliphila]TRW48424.1 RNA polymerase sigma factor [Aliidiomarina halalkaliphila]
METQHPFLQWYGGAIGFATSLLGCRESARDVVQQALYKSLSARRVPTDVAAQKVWFFKVVRNLCINGLHQEQRFQRHVDADALAASFVDTDESHERSERIAWVRQGLAKLTPEQREIVVLRDVNDLSYDDLAEVLGIERGTVMSRLHRARMALRDHLIRLQTQSGGATYAN